MLGFFKYFNFFADSLIEAFASLGVSMNARSLDIILPVGISFYTFQTLSYSIDIYRGKMEPSRDIIAFFAYVAFFPQLVAGPIERAVNLLPQFTKQRKFTLPDAKEGMRQILGGLFKKVIIADYCAVQVDVIFSNYDSLPGSTLLLGLVYFAFQVYGDFSGYSDIAIGTARLFGFTLMRNFAYPFFSRDIAELWRRWHISLSTWFRDYLYYPLGGSRGRKWFVIRNIVIIFTVSGFWHGADWRFIIWGFMNGIYFIPLFLLNMNRQNLDTVAENRILPNPKEILQMSFTFFMFILSLSIFRSQSVMDGIHFNRIMFSESLFVMPNIEYLKLFPLIVLFTLLEWFRRTRIHVMDIGDLPRPIRWGLYVIVGFVVLLAFDRNPNAFFYFQF
jgi:D-alanyl-lipoteichoic acid acyltransferase DltB (MBOAT superfamily)